MQKPLVIAYHLIWTVYGWWLPNDPRGSGSSIVRNPAIGPLGELHHGRKVNQPAERKLVSSTKAQEMFFNTTC